jgi:hypothetical protein
MFLKHAAFFREQETVLLTHFGLYNAWRCACGAQGNGYKKTDSVRWLSRVIFMAPARRTPSAGLVRGAEDRARGLIAGCSGGSQGPRNRIQERIEHGCPRSSTRPFGAPRKSEKFLENVLFC